MAQLRKRTRIDLQRLITPRYWWEFLGFAVLALMINLVAAGNPIGIVFVIALTFFWWFVDFRRAQKQLNLVGYTVIKEPPLPASGLILLLSKYSPFDPALKDWQHLSPFMQTIANTPATQLEQKDFDNIGLLNSNLFPQIKAVEFHLKANTLRDVWLITSANYSKPDGNVHKGSEETALILEKYLRFCYGEKVHINTDNLSVKDWDYASLWQKVDDIFRKSGYKEEVLVADITGGTKMMSIAMAMACTPPKRRMQYMDSERDWQGNPLPKGEVSPVAIDIDPILDRSSLENFSHSS